MSHEYELSDPAAERALEALAAGTVATADHWDDPQVLAYLGALAALPMTLEPRPPRAELRGEILQRATRVEATPLPMTRRPQQQPPRGRTSWPSWLLPVAAILALCVVGLGLLAMRLEQRLAGQDDTIAQLSQQLEESQSANSELASMRRQLDDLNQRFVMITRTAARLYPLHPTAQASNATYTAAQELRGVMYVCSEHQRWYVNLQGLHPAPEGREYHLWFITDQGPVDGRAFQVVDGQPTELRAQTMPARTHGVAVSIEPATAATRSLSAPTGPIVLKGDQSMQI